MVIESSEAETDDVGPGTVFADAEPSSVAPSTVGRYRLLEQIGKGGMGTVHSAFDPEIERLVAVKLIYARKGPQERLRREAQAIARVSHPNVISVYDVGEFEFAGSPGVYMVMELVEGVDLRVWLGERDRSLAEVLALFIQAGRALEAAHQMGVIHRDFKPANVLVSSRGQALVLDFGLARGVGVELEGSDDPSTEAVSEESAGSSSGSSSRNKTLDQKPSASSSLPSSMLTVPLTSHGTVMGTPRYMSPEQHLTNAVDARSDQYSFCLALYVELYGKLPFDESDKKELARMKLAGITEWSSPTVPPHIQRALRRGLDPNPDQRWPDMGQLVQALADDPAGRRRRWLMLGAGATLLAAVIGGGLVWDQRSLAACDDQRAWLGTAWSPSQRGSVEQAFAAVDRPYAGKALEQVVGQLDRYANTLSSARSELCIDTHRDRIEASVATARRACLDDRHARLHAVASRFAEADEALVEHAADVFTALPAIEPCTKLERYAPAVDSDPEERRAIEAELFEVELIAAAGQQGEALARFDPLLTRARALDDPHTLALTLLRGGELYGSARELDRAEAMLAESAMLAERHGDHDVAIDALSSLAHTLEDMRGRWDDAQRTLDFATAKYQREPGGTVGEWRLHYVQAGIYTQDGRTEQAIAEYRLAVEAARGGQPPMVLAKALHALAFTEAHAGELEPAQAHAQESIDLRVGVYGPEHPSLMYPLRALAQIALDSGRHAEAIEHLDRAIALGVRQHGADALGLVEPHTEKAKVFRQLGRYQDALTEYEEALRLRRINGDVTSEVLRLQSQVLLRLDRAEDALDRADQALAAHREELGDDEKVPWLRSRFVMHRGEALLALGRHEEALGDFLRAAALRASEKSDALLVRIWTGEGECRLALNDRAGAASAFERARAHREAGNDDGLHTNALLDFGLAKTADEPESRRRWAESAIAGFESAGGDDDLAQGVRAWLQASDHQQAAG